MKLTGKSLIDFEKWYLNRKGNDVKRDVQNRLNYLVFLSSEDAMKYGVYVDWFDSVGIEITIHNNFKGIYKFGYKVMNMSCYGMPNKHETRPEARTAAIQKANENYNNLK